MNIFKSIIIVVLTLTAFFSCQSAAVKKDNNPQREFPENLPEDLWISDPFVKQLDVIIDYYDQARQKLVEGDTIGAEIYYNQGFEILAGFNDEDRISLQNWPEYDSLFSVISEEYDLIYPATNFTLEAEEIREDIVELEERSFPDSVVFGEDTIVDTSGAMPITLNRKVRLAIKYFQTKGRFVFTKWLERSGQYEEMIREVLKEKDVPQELVYLAMIESGFNPGARSYARAVGMWQFIGATGRYYGLRQNWWFDERCDYYKATEAAAQHLSDLHDRFGDWYLALAGYNCNPKKVESNMRRYNTRDFWKLKRLPRQTRNYVPTFLAATIIAKNPKQFGFFVEKKKPIKVEPVVISESVDLNVIATLADTTYAFIKKANPAVRRWVTPPGIKDFTIYIPEGKKQKFETAYAKLPDSEKRSWVRHRIREGQSLSTIARKYHTTVSVIKSTNKLRSNRIRAGHYLLVPVPQNKSQYYASQSRNYSSSKKRSKKRTTVTNVPGSKKISYMVKRGDTLGEIAELYNTRASRIRSWNGLGYGDYIRPKQKLTIWVPENMNELRARVSKDKKVEKQEIPGTYYTVRRGDTLWDISRKYGVSISDLRKLNNMRSSRIRPGDRLRVAKN